MFACSDFKSFLRLLYQMANRKGCITVPLGEQLLVRVNTLAKARLKSTTQLVRDWLSAETTKHQKLIDEILEREEKIQREYASENENGQGEIRRGSPSDAGETTTKRIGNKGRKKGSAQG
jgi:hypothetical protein